MADAAGQSAGDHSVEPTAVEPAAVADFGSNPGMTTMISSPSPDQRAMNPFVNAVQSLLDQQELTTVDALCDHVRQNFPSIHEHELFPLVMGALAGAQYAAHHHFIVERGRVAYKAKMVHVAINSGSNLALWNMGLSRLERAPSRPASDLAPNRTVEVSSQANPSAMLPRILAMSPVFPQLNDLELHLHSHLVSNSLRRS